MCTAKALHACGARALCLDHELFLVAFSCPKPIQPAPAGCGPTLSVGRGTRDPKPLSIVQVVRESVETGRTAGVVLQVAEGAATRHAVITCVWACRILRR